MPTQRQTTDGSRQRRGAEDHGPAQAQEMIAKGDTLVVDVRDGTEVAASGKVAGAVTSRAAPGVQGRSGSPDPRQEFRQGQAVILYCASGGRAALAGKLLKDFGYERSTTSAASRTGSRPAARSTSRGVAAARHGCAFARAPTAGYIRTHDHRRPRKGCR